MDTKLDELLIYLGVKSNTTETYDCNPTSHYFKRFFISWIIWNWKPILIIFLDKKNILLKPDAEFDNKIEWISNIYHSNNEVVNHLFFYPALTSFGFYIVLEGISILSFIVTKIVWHRKMAIERFFDSKTNAPSKTISFYRNEKKRDEEELNTSRITSMEKDITIREKLNEIQNKQLEINGLNTTITALRQKELNLLSTKEQKDLKDNAKVICTKLYKKPHLLKSFKENFDKINRNGNQTEINNVTAAFTTLENEGLFEKLDNSNTYKITKLGFCVSSEIEFSNEEEKL